MSNLGEAYLKTLFNVIRWAGIAFLFFCSFGAIFVENAYLGGVFLFLAGMLALPVWFKNEMTIPMRVVRTVIVVFLFCLGMFFVPSVKNSYLPADQEMIESNEEERSRPDRPTGL